MLLLDTLLVAPFRFVLTRILEAVEAELDDETTLREALLAVQMRFELGEIGEDELAEAERAILGRLREIRAERTGTVSPAGSPGVIGMTRGVVGTTRVAGIEATLWSEHAQRDDR
jgi:gas vesicle protein GvpG